MGVPPFMDNFFFGENPLEMDDLGVPSFMETPRFDWNRLETAFARGMTQPTPQRAHDILQQWLTLSYETQGFAYATQLTTILFQCP